MTIAELRSIRTARGLSLTEVSARTRIGIGYLRKIEAGDLQGLPSGFYTRAFVRAYVEAIGEDPVAVMATLADELPKPAATEAAGDAPAMPQADPPLTDEPPVAPDARMQVVKKLLDRHDEAQRCGGEGRPLPRRLLASSIDGALLATIYLAVVAVTAAYCGVSVPVLMRVAGLAVCTVLALITLFYILLMGGIAGSTVGAMVADVPLVARSSDPLDLGAIARRTVACLRADVSAAAEVRTLVEGILGRSRRAA